MAESALRQQIEQAVEQQERGGKPGDKVPGVDGLTNPMPYPDDYQTGVNRGLKRRAGRLGDDPKDYGVAPPVMQLGPGKYIGDVNLNQWKERVETHLRPEEIAQARNWYRDALPAFRKYFGEEMAPKMAGAWLLANKNVDPAGAQLNALRISEQLRNMSQEFSKQKKGGLAHPELMQYWNAIKSGDLGGMAKLGGQKIYDFIDSFLGKKTRTYYGDDPRMGAPAVADVHSLRDMGHMDEPLLKWVEETYGPEAAKGLKKTFPGSPTEAQYEWAADKMRNFTDQLNKEKYMGGNWTPEEVQAVGWKTMSSMLGRAGQTPEEAIQRHIRHVSGAFSPAKGSPYAEQFPEIANLTPEQHTALSRHIMPMAADFAREMSGAHPYQQTMGLGGARQPAGSNESPFSDSMTQRLIASPEVAGGYTDLMGHLLQSKEMLTYRPGMGNHYGVAVHGAGFENPQTVRDFWDRFTQAHPDLADGFSPSIHEDGRPGIEMVFHQGGKTLLNRLNNEVRPSLDRISGELGIDSPEAKVFRAETEKRGHDWEADPTGGSYMARASQQYGPDLQGRVEDFKRQQFEPAIRGFLDKIKGPGAEAGAAPTAEGAPPEEPLAQPAAPQEGAVSSQPPAQRRKKGPGLAQLMAAANLGGNGEEQSWSQ